MVRIEERGLPAGPLLKTIETMAHIEHSVKLQTAGLVLSESDCKAIAPILRRAKKHADALAEKYKDIIAGGEATDRQQTLAWKYDTNAEMLSIILDEVEFMCK